MSWDPQLAHELVADLFKPLLVANRAVQVFGGRALTKTGGGSTIAHFNQTHHFNSVLGQCGVHERFHVVNSLKTSDSLID